MRFNFQQIELKELENVPPFPGYEKGPGDGADTIPQSREWVRRDDDGEDISREISPKSDPPAERTN